eukprot:TRINITY_DN15397_c0_g1_i2.p1 TRINITY_DN15397_c0_g1~~TRINITY_DN15397_c0_g1_i2.p1  ORF type:complete len:150 (-),score=44.62 TRINITY_DN15397_c0_g1_i2:24-473(-)
MLRSLVGSEMCMRDSINAEYGGALYQAAGGMQDAWLDKHTDLAHRIDELQVDAQEVARLSRAGKDTTRIQSQLSRDSAKLTTWLESLRRTLPNLPLSDQEAGRRSGMLIRTCLLYTSDAADEEDSVDLGGRRIIKKKKKGREMILIYIT